MKKWRALTSTSRIKRGKHTRKDKVAWEIGDIAQRNHVGVVSREVRRLSDTGGHTGNMVPVFAFGPGADKFEGVLDNIDIPRLILEVSNMG